MPHKKEIKSSNHSNHSDWFCSSRDVSESFGVIIPIFLNTNYHGNFNALKEGLIALHMLIWVKIEELSSKYTYYISIIKVCITWGPDSI